MKPIPNPHLIDEGIAEGPKGFGLEDLHDAVWPIVEPYYNQEQELAIDHFQELTVTNKATTDLKEVLPAAYFGRVEQLFVAVGEQQWGNFDPSTNELQLHPDAEPGDEDLLNTAAIQTLLNGGEVYAMEPQKVPEQGLIAAVFRY